MRHRKHFVEKEEPQEEPQENTQEKNDLPQIDFLQIIADDKSLITYRPKLNQITGSVTATILLQQILYWWKKSDEKPFYKFKAPCNHPLFKNGDSWGEELGFTPTEFDSALKKIACKTTKKEQTRGNKLVYYWVTRDRLTFYNINISNLAKQGFLIYVNKDSCFRKTRIPDLDINTEITQETTSVKENIYILFLDEWNKNKIIIHTKITSKKEASIKKALRDYTQKEIFKAFQNYSTVLKSPDYFWDYKWTLEDFLQRGLHKFVDEAEPLNAFKNNNKFSSNNKEPEQTKTTELSQSGFPLISRSYGSVRIWSEKTSNNYPVSSKDEWQELFENLSRRLMNFPIWKENYTPNKIVVFNRIVAFQEWLDNVDFNFDGGINIKLKMYPLDNFINYFVICVNDWWNWMDGIKDEALNVNSKIFKMFIREMETSSCLRVNIKSKGWVNDSDWEPRD